MKLSPVIHPDNDTLLQFVSDELSEQLSSDISHHIDECPTCQEQLEAIVDGGYIGKALKSTESNSLLFGNDDHLMIIEKIASGGMGVVYRGFDSELKREVAIKVAIDGDQQSRQFRFYREAQISSQLQHPGIAPVYRIGRLKNGNQFIAMKLVVGQTLKQKIASGDVGEDQSQRNKLIEVFQQVCQTIAYSHSRGIMHRDLKPENIMVGAFGEVQVMDWGLAKSIGQPETNDVFDESFNETKSAYETRHGSVIGTPAYMPPEQALGQLVDQRADVFALGAILCEIMTGKPPFAEATVTRAIAKASGADLGPTFSALTKCDAEPEFVELAKACLAQAPEDRPENAKVLNDRLKAIFARKADRLREMELNQARADERLVAEQRRRRQFYWSAAMIGAVLLFTGVATLLFVAERNARQSEKLSRELEVKQQEISNERKLGLIIGRTLEHCNAAVAADDVKAIEQWKLATAEFEHVEDLAEGIGNNQLRQDVEDLKRRISDGSQQTAFRVEQRRMAAQLTQAVGFVERRIKSPDVWAKDGVDSTALQRIESAFKSLGVKRLCDVAEGVEKLKIIDDRQQLLRATMLWQRQYLGFANAQNDADFLETQEWFWEFWNMLDANVFRQRQREFLAAKNIDEQHCWELLSIAEDPSALESPINCYLMVACLKHAGLSENQRQFLTQAHLAFPDDLEINWLLSKVYEQRKFGPTGARTGLRHMLVCFAAQPNNVGVLTKLAEFYYRLNELNLAKEIADRLEQLAPNQATTHSILSGIHSAHHESLQDCDKAIAYAKKAIELNPKLADPYFNLSRSYQRYSEFEAALDAVDQLASVDPTNHHVHHRRGLVYQQAERHEEALESGLKALEAFPDAIYLLTFVAKSYRLCDMSEKAIPIYDSVIERAPLQWNYHILRAETLLELNRFEEAQDRLEQVWQCRTRYPSIWILMTEALAGQGDHEAAVKEARKMVEAIPGNKDAILQLEKIQVAAEVAN